MSKVDQVRTALQPLINQGIVTEVMKGARPLLKAGDPPLQIEPVAVDVVVEDGTDHDIYRPEIGERVANAAITGVRLVLRPRLPRS